MTALQHVITVSIFPLLCIITTAIILQLLISKDTRDTEREENDND